MRFTRHAFIGAALLLLCTDSLSAAGEATEADLSDRFSQEVVPFLETYCQSCHEGEEAEAKLDLTEFAVFASATEKHQSWDIIRRRLEAGEMPPLDSDPLPSAEQSRRVIEWIEAVRKFEAHRNAGDPGSVMVRRLSNAEYNYTIRDLTGADIQPTREFPVDPSNEAGFDNSGESLSMTPALTTKYLEAARHVAEHLVLKPQGIAFAPHPVVTDTDRDKYCVKRIVQFYERQPTDYADYFQATWKYRHREKLGRANVSLAEIANESGVSAKYLATVWNALAETQDVAGPLARLQEMWQALPSPDDNQPNNARAGCEQMRDFLVKLRRKLEPTVEGLHVRGIHEGAQAFVLWKNRQYMAGRRSYSLDALTKEDEESEEGEFKLRLPEDEAERSRYEASLKQFCSVFPDAFYVSERGRDYLGEPREKQEKGRLLSAGFHSMMGYFRDDTPLYDLVLDEQQQAELDGLWQELDFVTSAPLRQYAGFLWFERTDSRFMRDPEFDFARAEDKNATSEDMINRLSEVYLDKARHQGAEGDSEEAIKDYFTNINAQIRWVESARLAAEPSHLDAFLKFAERAYRRPLVSSEREGLLEFYRSLRAEELSHEEAMQDLVVSVLMSPHFCYRMDLAATSEETRPLTDYELASRLSYFLWSSMPDEQLLARAAAGELHQPDVLIAEARRMVQDDRVRALAVEFGGNWLDFRRFEEHNSVDRGRFPSFTNELRKAMFEEPVRFIVDVIQHDASVLDFINGKYTFVTPVLAKHYGMPELSTDSEEWARIDDAATYGRGGLLPMAAFLTQNSPGLRTSPVKRGYWVTRRLLGEQIPPPPPNVPELPADESQLGELTLRETLERHRAHESCAACHRRFDSIGLVFEGFGPVGERRDKDLGGRDVDTLAVFPDGSEGAGLEGLKTYLQTQRQQDFLDNLSEKLLSYALGRTLLLSDDSTLKQMDEALTENDDRFSSLIETIIVSPQFLNKRGAAALVQE